MARNPDQYQGRFITFTGNVIQVQEGNTVVLRINQDNNYEDRIKTLEKQVRNLDSRLQKIESTTQKDDNFYMI